MKKDIENLLFENRKHLPILAEYWEIDLAEKENIEIKEQKITSILHNTSRYLPFSLYKPISTSIDLTKFYE